jgi:3-dehydroquinate synthase
MRGMDWVNIPTTLLAQVDSAIGGKTAVNHKLGKNMIGLVYQPKLVVVDPSYLSSLGLRDQISGLGELLKYGLCFDRELFKELTAGKFSLEKVISRALKIKVGVVEKDEFDLKGVREVLNFGHTVGHALEKCARFGEFRHGEAVILGMRVEAVISRIRGHLSRDVQRKIDWELARVQIPKVPKSVTFKKIGEAIENDKKKIGGKVRFVLLKGIGKTVLDSGVKTSEIEQAWREVVG